MSGYPQVVLTEEGMREGMQIESAEIPVADKIRLLDALSETGLPEIVVGSFVSPKWTPQMARIDEIVRGFHPKPGVTYTATVLNEKGVERAREYMPPLSERKKEYQTSVGMCDVFAQRNTNRTQAQEIARLPKVIERAKERGAKAGGISLSAAWGSNWSGEFTQEQRMRMLARQWQLWDAAGIPVTAVSLSDAMGWGMPDQIERQLVAIKEQWPAIRDFNLHLHNTRGVAIASVYAALKVLDATDILRLQPTIGGMAGCPYCGNGRAAQMIPTEDLVYMLEEMGIPTGVDLDKLIEVVWMAEEVVGHPLYGHVSKAGPRPRYQKLYPMDMPFIETLDEAKHFLKGPSVYQHQMSPWKAPIRSWQRPESPAAPNGHAPNGHAAPPANGATAPHAAGATPAPASAS
jgi:hydroxymethylglutaryl-CoA lyase